MSSVRLLDQLLVLGVQGQFPFAQCVISSFVRPGTSVRCTRAVSVCAVCHQFGFVRPGTSVRCTRAAAMTGSDRVRTKMLPRVSN